MAQRFSQRRLLVINPKLQFRYLVLPLLVATTMAACLFALFILQSDQIKWAAGSDAGLQDEIGRQQLVTALGVGAVLLGHVTLVVWLGLTASHRVAGPAYRFTQAMNKVAAGDMSVRIRLREKDQLIDVADAFNRMMDALTVEEEQKEPGESGEPAAPPGPSRPGA